jgi:hypothetical protein
MRADVRPFEVEPAHVLTIEEPSADRGRTFEYRHRFVLIEPAQISAQRGRGVEPGTHGGPILDEAFEQDGFVGGQDLLAKGLEIDARADEYLCA